MPHAPETDRRRRTPRPLDPSDAVRMSERAEAVDAAALAERAASIATRAIGVSSELETLELVVRSMDLTSLEGSDTPEKIAALCARAVRPDPLDDSLPSAAAVCVYPQLVPVAARALEGTGVRVASVAGGFPAALTPLDARLLEIRAAVDMGADEVDVVLNRSLFLSGRYDAAFEELAASREAAGGARLKVILEAGELETYDAVRRASTLAMAAGADFIKTSTGKHPVGATLPAALCMVEAIGEFHREIGRSVGFKAAGGIRTFDRAIRYAAVVRETLGSDWLAPDRFRIGASSLLDDVVARVRLTRTDRERGSRRPYAG